MADTRKPRPGDKIKLHHPIIRREVIRTRRQAKILAESGWCEGPMPPPEPVNPVTPPSGDEGDSESEAKSPAKKTTAPKTGEGK